MWLVLFLISGCGTEGNQGYQRVMGSVSYKGQPLADGTIQFFSLATAVPLGGAVINQGKFELPAEHGLKPGKYGVRISSAESVKNTGPAAEMNPIIPRERLAAKYNTQSKLQVDIAESSREIQFTLE